MAERTGHAPEARLRGSNCLANNVQRSLNLRSINWRSAKVLRPKPPLGGLHPLSRRRSTLVELTDHLAVRRTLQSMPCGTFAFRGQARTLLIYEPNWRRITVMLCKRVLIAPSYFQQEVAPRPLNSPIKIQ